MSSRIRNYKPRRKRSFFTGDRLAFLGIVALLVLVIGSCVARSVQYKASAEHNVTFTVHRLETRTESSGSGETLTVQDVYYVFTDGEVFQNRDTFLFGKYNSSDVQNELDEGVTCRGATVAGWRSNFWSSYRNIIDPGTCE